MNRIKNKCLVITLCLMFSSQSIRAGFFYLEVMGYTQAVMGAALLLYCGPATWKSEEKIMQELMDKLQKSIDQRRAAVDITIDKIQNELEALSNQKEESKDFIKKKQRLNNQLRQACEEYEAIDWDYKQEYIRIRPRVRFLKDLNPIGFALGGVLVLSSIFYLSFLKNHMKPMWHTFK